MQISFQAFLAGAIQPSTPSFHQKRQTPAEALESHRKKPPPLTRGCGMEERGRSAGRLTPIEAPGFWENIQTQAHTPQLTGREREPRRLGRRGKDSRKPSNSIRQHIPAGGQVQPRLQHHEVTPPLLDSPHRQCVCPFAETKSLQLTHAPNQKRFANRPPDLVFLVALELPRLLGEVSPASLFCFLY